MLLVRMRNIHGKGVKKVRGEEGGLQEIYDQHSVAENSGEGWLCCSATSNTRGACCKLSSLKQTYTALHCRKDRLSAYNSISLQAAVVSLSPRAPGQKTRSRSILANSNINDDCQMPTWLSISYYQMRLR